MTHYRTPQPGEGWRHYKGGLYDIIAVGTHTETLQPVVIYKDSRSFQGAGSPYVRPLESFLAFVEREETIPSQQPRFRFERTPEENT